MSTKTPLPKKCPVYATKPSDGEVPVLELWGMWSTLSLPLLSGLFWSGMVVSVRVLSMSQIELSNLLLGIIIII